MKQREQRHEESTRLTRRQWAHQADGRPECCDQGLPTFEVSLVMQKTMLGASHIWWPRCR